MRKRRGFFLEDAAVGLALVALLAGLLALALNRQNHAARKLADTRAALRLAEQTLLDLQTGQARPPDPRVQIRPLEPPPLPGQTWVEVAAESQGQRITLLGAIPQSSSIQKGAPQ